MPFTAPITIYEFFDKENIAFLFWPVILAIVSVALMRFLPLRSTKIPVSQVNQQKVAEAIRLYTNGKNGFIGVLLFINVCLVVWTMVWISIPDFVTRSAEGIYESVVKNDAERVDMDVNVDENSFQGKPPTMDDSHLLRLGRTQRAQHEKKKMYNIKHVRLDSVVHQIFGDPKPTVSNISWGIDGLALPFCFLFFGVERLTSIFLR